MLTTAVSRKWVRKYPLHISLYDFVCVYFLIFLYIYLFLTREREHEWGRNSEREGDTRSEAGCRL